MPTYPTSAERLTPEERHEFISAAKNVCSEFQTMVQDCSGSLGTYEREDDIEIVVALDLLALNGFYDDADHACIQFGRTLLVTDQQGFVTFEVFKDAEEASQYLS